MNTIQITWKDSVMSQIISLSQIMPNKHDDSLVLNVNRETEKNLFVAMLIISKMFWICLGLFLIPYIIIFFVVALLSDGLFLASIRSNSVKLGPVQFPEIYERLCVVSQKLQMQEIPDVYVAQAGGALNAFATRFLSRNYVVIFSDVLEMAFNDGEAAVDFVLSHELAHLYCKHTYFWKSVFIIPAKLIPFLGQAYSRACEYTCDAIANNLVPTGSQSGLLSLACGTSLYKRINVNAYINQIEQETGFFAWLNEVLSTHPNLTKRLKKVSTLILLSIILLTSTNLYAETYTPVHTYSNGQVVSASDAPRAIRERVLKYNAKSTISVKDIDYIGTATVEDDCNTEIRTVISLNIYDKNVNFDDEKTELVSKIMPYKLNFNTLHDYAENVVRNQCSVILKEYPQGYWVETNEGFVQVNEQFKKPSTDYVNEG